MKTPPLLPEETLHRVLRTATFDGWSVLVIAGVLALASAAAGSFWDTSIGLLVAAAGAIELHGVGLMRAGDSRGMRWVVASQPYLLVTILGYCALRMWSYDPALLREAMTSEMRGVLAQKGVTEERLKNIYLVGYVVLALGTMIYQGGMTLFYYRRVAAVDAALASEWEDEPAETTS